MWHHILSIPSQFLNQKMNISPFFHDRKKIIFIPMRISLSKNSLTFQKNQSQCGLLMIFKHSIILMTFWWWHHEENWHIVTYLMQSQLTKLTYHESVQFFELKCSFYFWKLHTFFSLTFNLFLGLSGKILPHHRKNVSLIQYVNIDRSIFQAKIP